MQIVPDMNTDAADNKRFPRITDEMVDALRARIGERLKDPHVAWITEATLDNCRHYALGVGDDNPLWWDPEYARTTPYGDVIGIPTMLFSCSPGGLGLTGMPGIHAMFAGCDFSWYENIRRNDPIRSEAMIKDIIEKKTKFAGRAIQQIHHIDFFTPSRGKIAECDLWNFRTDRDEAREKGQKYDRTKDPRTRYSRQQMDEFLSLYENEYVRGAEPRYWEDVTEGEQLPMIAKGPMTVSGFIAYVQGWGGIYIRAHKLYYRQIKKLPALAIYDDYGVPDSPEAVHWRDDFARMVGAPAPYDYGSERCSWMGHLVTNWMGDLGFLHRLQVKVRWHNAIGDLLYLRGNVTRKWREQGAGYVDIALEARNQDNQLSADGSATVRLPSTSQR